MRAAKLKLVTYQKEEQILAEKYLLDTCDSLTDTYNTKFTIQDLLNIASSTNEIAARRVFNSVLIKHDVYVDSNEMNSQIADIVSAYNNYATLIGFGNCVGDEIAQIAHSKVAKVSDVWPKDVQGQYRSTSDVYMTSNTDFRQNVRDRASRKLNYLTNLGVMLTLTPQEIELSNVTVTSVEVLCSVIDQFNPSLIIN